MILLHSWSFWARKDQMAPEGDGWLTWLILAGRGFGKTRSGAEWVRSLVESGKYGRIAIVAEDAADARDVMVEGESGIMGVSPPWATPIYEPSKKRLTWPNGARAHLYSAEDPEALRGPQHDAAWCDELAKWGYAQETWDQLQFGLRLGRRPVQLITTTPRPIPLLKKIIARKSTVVTKGTTWDNRANLAREFYQEVIVPMLGTRIGRQEIEAEILDDLPGALWLRKWFDEGRRRANDDNTNTQLRPAPEMQRVVVAIDPSGTKGATDGGDDIGIIAAGKGIDDRGYVMKDYTCKLSPAGWGRRAIELYHEVKADLMVAEINFGGAMVENVIRTCEGGADINFRVVTASRGKVARAEPVANLYEQGRISHVGELDELEDQMVLMGPDGYIGEGSPDRVDGVVWALSTLFLDKFPYSTDDLRKALA